MAKKQHLENDENNEGFGLVRPQKSGVDLSGSMVDIDDELEVDEDDVQLDPADLEDDEEEPEEDEGEEEESDDEEEEEDSEPSKPTGKPASKAESKIVALKRELQQLKQENATLKTTKQEEDISKTQADLIAGYKSRGYDDDTAEIMAEKDIAISKMQKDVDILKFRTRNASVLGRYPKSEADLEKIMRAVDYGGLTVEEVCRGMYGTERKLKEQRARETMQGKFEETPNGKSLSSTTRSQGQPKPVALTQAQQRRKAQIERLFLGGEKIEESDYARIHRR